MRLYFTLLLLLAAMPLFAQQSDLKRELLEMEESKPELISRGRRLLLERFESRDLAKMAEVKSFLVNEVEDQNHLVLFLIERILVSYWIGDYTDVLSHSHVMETEDYIRIAQKIKPTGDFLAKTLITESRREQPVLTNKLKNTPDLSSLEKEFLALNLLYLLEGPDYPEISQEELNFLADKFLASYPANDYEAYTREYIRQRFEASKWGLSAEFFTGYGVYTGQLESEFKNSIPFGIAFDVIYSNWVLFLRNYIGITRNKNDVPITGGVWPARSQARMFLPELSIGYRVADTPTFGVTPFAGFAWMDLGPTIHDMQQNQYLQEAALTFRRTPTVGLNLDIKMGSVNGLVSPGQEQSFWFIRLRYAYQTPQYERKYNAYAGSLHNLTVGVGGTGRRVKKVY
ncbi:hypothetical protein ADIS_0528 [Lunatimonas lonarensis]|uniref:Uncharacterized protein n=1 Tax=Lunatimonas lonarensis TaxID=1232681 RepID=R7ZXP9_9BACT|nr:hypothetical protein [Lunatimonas lonarensis]EON78935.1 hypothetical protein ADIS_0528 [Lunatimonas lonarensis]